MITIAMLIAGLGLLAFVMDGSDDTPTDEDPQTPDTPEDPPEDQPVDPPEDPRAVLTLSGADDTLEITAENQIEGGQIVEGGAGDDRIQALESAQNVLVNGGEGDDILVAGGNNVVDGGEGNDDIFVNGDEARGYGGAGDDALRVFSGTSGQVYGGMGNDTLSTVNSTGELHGDEGNDYIVMNGLGNGFGGDGDDVFNILHAPRYTDADFDELGPLTATGGAGADTFGILANNNNNPINTGVRITDFDNDEDLLVFALPSGFGPDSSYDLRISQDINADMTSVVFHSGGVDFARADLDGIVDIDRSDIGVIIDRAGYADATAGENFGSVQGTEGDDTLAGTAGDTITAGGGDDVVVVSDTNAIGSEVEGGAGNDRITVDGGGAIRVEGGAGDDTIVAEQGERAVLFGGDGDDVIEFTPNTDPEVTDIDGRQSAISGGDGADTITVGDFDNLRVSLGDGNDIANVGEGVSVTGYGDGDDVVNVEIGADLTRFGDFATLVYDSPEVPPNRLIGFGAGDTVNINLADPDSGSFHILRLTEEFDTGTGPEADYRVFTYEALVWSADPDADVDGATFDLNRGADVGFTYIAAVQTSETTVSFDGERETVTQQRPEINMNVEISSISDDVYQWPVFE